MSIEHHMISKKSETINVADEHPTSPPRLEVAPHGDSRTAARQRSLPLFRTSRRLCATRPEEAQAERQKNIKSARVPVEEV